MKPTDREVKQGSHTNRSFFLKSCRTCQKGKDEKGSLHVESLDLFRIRTTVCCSCEISAYHMVPNCISCSLWTNWNSSPVNYIPLEFWGHTDQAGLHNRRIKTDPFRSWSLDSPPSLPPLFKHTQILWNLRSVLNDEIKALWYYWNEAASDLLFWHPFPQLDRCSMQSFHYWLTN